VGVPGSSQERVSPQRDEVGVPSWSHERVSSHRDEAPSRERRGADRAAGAYQLSGPQARQRQVCPLAQSTGYSSTQRGRASSRSGVQAETVREHPVSALPNSQAVGGDSANDKARRCFCSSTDTHQRQPSNCRGKEPL
ncbi:unnamed protein product, partial [Polarella glacialis]